MKLKGLLRQIAEGRQGFEDIETYLEHFVPDILMKSSTLQEAFGISDYELEKLYNEAYEAYEEDRMKEAVTLFRWLVFFNPYDVRYWMGLAATQQFLSLFEKALHSYAMVALLDDENPRAHFQAYQCYAGMGESVEAACALALAKELSEGKPDCTDLLEEICQLESNLAQSL